MKKLLTMRLSMMCFLLFFSVYLSANIFDQTSMTFDSIYLAGTAWGDYDNDGDLDLLYSGYPSTGAGGAGAVWLYKNQGNNSFLPVTTPFVGTGAASVNFVDANNDQLLDVFITGQSATNVYTAKLYLNNGNDSFTPSQYTFQGVTTGSSDWADFDQDGLSDLLLTGKTTINEQSVNITYVYKNLGNDNFSLINANLPGVSSSHALWGDYDNDGDMDVAITGSFETSVYITKIFKNNNGIFNEITGNFAGIRYSKCRWADYDADGDLDLLATGSNNNNTASFIKIYRNDGNDNFAVVDPGFEGVRQGDLVLGDVNNDGYLDLLLGGLITTTIYAGNVYTWNPANQSYAIADTLLEAKYTIFALGDYNNDGDLDVHFNGKDADINYNQIFSNVTATPNTPPSAPQNLNSEVIGNNVTLSWNVASDNNTPPAALTYNIYIGTAAGNTNIISPNSLLSNGYRKITGQGNVGSGLIHSINNLQPGTYYWSVQSIDNSFAGSAFSPQQTFIITDPSQTTAAPVFNPDGNIFDSPVTVTISSATPSASIWYTLDGSTPQMGGNLYTQPIQISTNTTLKAIATSQNLWPSSVISAQYRFPQSVASLSVLRNMPVDENAVYKINTEVVLTAKHNYRNQKFVQDDSSAVMIDDLNNILQINPNIGDGITNLTGRLTLFDGMLQFVPLFNNANISSTGNTILPMLTSFNALNANPALFESKLVKIHNIDFSSNGSFAVNQNYNVNDQTGDLKFKTLLQNADYLNTQIPGERQTITAIFTRSATENFITARSLSDFSISFPAPVNLTGSIVDSAVVITWQAPLNTQIELLGYNLYKNSQLLNNTPLSAQTLNYTDHNIVIGNAYSYYLTAVYSNPQGTSAQTQTILIQFGDNPLPPQNLHAELVLNDVNLSWLAPGSVEPSWIHWDSGEHQYNTGTSESSAQEFMSAVRFTGEDLTDYNQMYLTKVKFWPHAPNCTYTLKVWSGGNQSNPGTLIHEQLINNITIDAWNEVQLSNPVLVNSTQELCFGIHYSTSAGFPAGLDAGPAINYKGNLMYWNGSWTTLLNLSASQDRNWNIQGYVAFPNAGRSERALLGYSVYRNGSLLNNNLLNELNYSDFALENGQYSYYVTASYSGNLISAHSNTVNVNITGTDNNSNICINRLYTNYPNPFNPTTSISYSLKEEARVSLKIYNVKGELIKTIVDGKQNRGLHNVSWDGKDNQNKAVSSGIYFYQINTPNFKQQKKMLLLK